MGVYAVLLTFGFIGSVVWLGSAVEKYGWRAAWSQLGWILLLGMVPLSLLARNPAAGADDADDSSLPMSADLPPVDFSFGQAIRAGLLGVRRGSGSVQPRLVGTHAI